MIVGEDVQRSMFLTILAERESEHPIAKSLVSYLTDKMGKTLAEFESAFELVEFKSVTGEGITGQVMEKLSGKSFNVRCGNEKLMNGITVPQDCQETIEQLEE